MLAPCFKTAEELGLTPSQRNALIRVLGMLERGELRELHGMSHGGSVRPEDEDGFSMRSWATCICGHAQRFAEFPESIKAQGGPTGSLFYRTCMSMSQATASLRDYLTGYAPAE
jgi:hypothetical protein